MIVKTEADRITEALVAMEFGFLQHEKGNNLEMAKMEFLQTWEG